jgi:hypothetical protein
MEFVWMAAPPLAFGEFHSCFQVAAYFEVAAYRSNALKRAPSECGIAHGDVRPTAAL